MMVNVRNFSELFGIPSNLHAYCSFEKEVQIIPLGVVEHQGNEVMTRLVLQVAFTACRSDVLPCGVIMVSHLLLGSPLLEMIATDVAVSLL